jgi:hypothetical protein
MVMMNIYTEWVDQNIKHLNPFNFSRTAGFAIHN